MSIALDDTLLEPALAALRRKGNPFRQQFARNSDDTVCSLYHVNELFAAERSILEELVESYRGEPGRPTTVLPVLGARGAGKTHLLHWLKHAPGVRTQLFVTPGTFRIDAGGPESSFLEYVLYQLINVLLAGGEQRGVRPLASVAEQVTRGLLAEALASLNEKDRLQLVPSSTLRQLGWKLGMGVRETLTAIDELARLLGASSEPCRLLAQHANLDIERLTGTVLQFVQRREPRDLKGELRKRILGGFVRATLLGDEAELADFLTDGLADVPFQVAPTRAQLTLSLLQALSEVIVGSGIPVAVAFDQLEELLYGQTADEIRRASDAFFGGIVQLMSQVPGLSVLLLVEEGLWNRIVPPLPSHILDRIHEPIHLPEHGTIRNVRLSTPTLEQLLAVVGCRVKRTLAGAVPAERLPAGFPFGLDFLGGLAKRETVLRLMLQGCCNRLDEIFAGAGLPADLRSPTSASRGDRSLSPAATPAVAGPARTAADKEPTVTGPAWDDLVERWHHELRSAERKLKPVGSLAGATEELHGGMARWLHLCKALGVEQGDWRMTDIQDQVRIGEHPTYGTLTVVEWTSSAGERRRVGIGLWLGRGVGKPRDLDSKLGVFRVEPAVVEHLILLRPADDARLSGKTLTAWQQAMDGGFSPRLEPVELDVFAKLYAFPRWMQQVSETCIDGKVPDNVYQFLAEQTESIMLKLGLPADAESHRPAA